MSSYIKKYDWILIILNTNQEKKVLFTQTQQKNASFHQTKRQKWNQNVIPILINYKTIQLKLKYSHTDIKVKIKITN